MRKLQIAILAIAGLFIAIAMRNPVPPPPVPILAYPIYFTGPVAPFDFSPGEYFSSVKDGNNAGFDIVGGTTSISGWPSVIVAMASGTHGQIAATSTAITTRADNNFTGWKGDGTTGSSAYTAFTVTADSSNVPFSNIIMVGSGGTLASNGWTFWMVEQGAVTDTLFAVGATDGGLHVPGPASGINTKWVKIGWITGKHIKKVQMDVFCFLLTTDGHVYDKGGSTAGFATQYCLAQGTATPVTDVFTEILVPGGGHTWMDISGGSFWNFLIRDDGKPYASAYYVGYTGVGANNQAYNQPNAINTLWQLDTALNLPFPIREITTNMTTTYAILTDGSLWAWGDNAMGGFGNGTQLDWANYTVSPSPTGGTPAPWNWDQGLGELFSHKPAQVAKGKSNFKHIYGTNALAPYIIVTDSSDAAFTCGRSKGGVSGDGAISAGNSGGIAASYPCSWNNYYLKRITPLATSSFQVTSPFCKLNPAGVPCNNYSIPVNGNPVCIYSIRYTNGMLISDLSLSTDLSGHLYHQIHRQTSGQPLGMGCQDQPVDTIFGAAPGQTYGFRGTVINPTFDSTVVTISFTVPNISSINIPKGTRIKPVTH